MLERNTKLNSKTKPHPNYRTHRRTQLHVDSPAEGVATHPTVPLDVLLREHCGQVVRALKVVPGELRQILHGK